MQINSNTPLILTSGQLQDVIKCAVQEAIKSLIPGAPIVETKSPYMGVDELSKMTGYPKSTIYCMVNRKEIPFYKPENKRKLLFKRSDIESWLKRTDTISEYVEAKTHEFSMKGGAK